MRISALVNTTAGSVGADGPQRMSRLLTSLGAHNPDVMVFDPLSAGEQIKELANREPDMLVIWGGDGTHRTALNALGLDGRRLLLLPGGTMNLLAKWLHGGRPWDAILRAVVSGCTARILGAGEADGALFFCALVAGAPAGFALAREDIRAGDFGKALHDAGSAFDIVTHLRLAAHTGSGSELAAGNVGLAMVGPMSRSSGMEVAGLNIPSAAAALGMAWSSLHSDWRTLDGVDVRRADILTIENPGGRPIPVIMDGEQVTAGPTLTVRYREAAATCLVAT